MSFKLIFDANRDVYIRQTAKDWVVERPSGGVISRHDTAEGARSLVSEYGYKKFSDRGGEHWRRDAK